MRAILVLALLVVILAFFGWVTFSNDPGRSSVNVETEKIERDIQGITDSVHDAGEEIRQNATGNSTDVSP